MNINIIAATKNDKLLLKRLLEFSEYELSSFTTANVNAQGEFGYEYLDLYWEEKGRHAFLAKIDENIVGFAMVNTHHYTPNANFCMAEFLIMRSYQHKGLGKTFAFNLFSQFPGTWEICQQKRHIGAQQFWRKVITEFTAGNYKEYDRFGEWDGPIQVFESKKRDKVNEL